jgi:hypothetical protein
MMPGAEIEPETRKVTEKVGSLIPVIGWDSTTKLSGSAKPLDQVSIS